MKAQIKEIGEIVIAGRKFLEVIPEDKNVDFMSAWMNFFEDIKDNFDMKNYKDCFGLSENMKMIDGKVAMDYVICMRKEAFDKVPEGFVTETIPGGKYAVYTYKGKIEEDKMSQFWNDIYSKWLGEEKLEPITTHAFEYYDHRWQDDSDDSELDIYVPIK